MRNAMEHDILTSGTSRVLDRKFRLSVLSCNTSDRTAQVLAIQGGLHVLDLELSDIEVVQSEKSDRIINVERQAESLHEIFTLLQRTGVRSKLRRSQLDSTVLDVHSHLQLQVFHQWRVDLGPVRLERSHAVWWHRDLPGLNAISLVDIFCGRKDGAAFFVDAHLTVFSRVRLGRGVGHIRGRRGGIDQDIVLIY